MMNKLAIGMVVLLALPATAAAREYMKCPTAMTKVCGQLKDPPSVGQGMVVRCGEDQMRELEERNDKWNKKMTAVRDDERGFANTTSQLSQFYKKYPLQSAYFRDISLAVEGLAGYMQGVCEDLGQAAKCMRNESYVKGGCWHVPDDCFSQGSIEKRIQKSEEAVDGIINDLKRRRKGLLAGLPTPCIGIEQLPSACHMSQAINTLIRVQQAIQEKF